MSVGNDSKGVGKDGSNSEGTVDDVQSSGSDGAYLWE